MTGDGETSQPAAKPRRPYQFTVRTFFAAAVWISLLFAAIKTLKGSLLGTSVALLVWIALGEVYRRLRWIGPLVALVGGPALLLVVWTVLLMATAWSPHREYVLPPESEFVAFALAWGIVLSLLIVIERVIEYGLLPRPRARGNVDAHPPSQGPVGIVASNPARCAVILFSVHTVFAIVMLVLHQANRLSTDDIAFTVLVLLDLPVLPLYILMLGPLDPQRTQIQLALLSLVLGGAFYTGSGFAIALVINRIRQRGTRNGPACPTADPGPTDGGRDS